MVVVFIFSSGLMLPVAHSRKIQNPNLAASHRVGVAVEILTLRAIEEHGMMVIICWDILIVAPDESRSSRTVCRLLPY
jgi:hypothetical protein